MSPRIKKPRARLIVTKLVSLKKELEVSKEIYESACDEARKLFQKSHSANQVTARTTPEIKSTAVEKRSHTASPHSEQEGSSIEDFEVSKQKSSPESKSLFRKIATKIHPDKIIDVEDEIEKSQKMAMYLLARSALEADDLISLVSIAMDLKIEPPEIPKERIKKAQNEISAIKKEISNIESTIVWHWFFCEEEEKKSDLLERLFGLMNEKHIRT